MFDACNGARYNPPNDASKRHALNAQSPISCPQAPESDDLDRNPAAGGDDSSVPSVADRGELMRRLLRAERRYAPECAAVAELVAERGGEMTLAVRMYLLARTFLVGGWATCGITPGSSADAE